MLKLQIPYVGRMHSGILKHGDILWALDSEGNKAGEAKVKKLFGRCRLERIGRVLGGSKRCGV
ncbi:uncharacterized protein LACBIDRAFT_316279 [Laccaria bicolor S238N-H82]|uniref:Predicted protein n=1 Tax=Laccaria bicolor (strain S238N-H82 / ATCC MYA-4686) TaxID=486041 RepID=B0DSZ7_LACBS|nr:uncharacterized protein LACBIDRAFT_309745 [Laccaria bicolor S238N-H82]XP_001889718.1 uncharacterized protein LACBIDRAFT_316279 [Laccaria bicolor S238N-H82]EDQ99607.1 predicted protein [Laccaria bicolor S238N-H82]EDR02324.1 predicted protein [Laccaria bicolor S238N-H82]|eukprot:XP_001887001.1 predicted protein [Laccaria bicolor S238N-H82]